MSAWPSAKARRVFAALKRIGWSHNRTVGSHKIMKREGWADYPFSFHDSDELGPAILAKISKKTGPRRHDLELLEAILTNCIRRGPDSQNRERHPNFRGHLEGRIGFVEMIHREKGRRLRDLFQEIRWDGPSVP